MTASSIADVALLEVVEVGKTFGSVVALRGVSMTVRAGEVMALLGDNGAGKSTLIKILSGVHLPTSGHMSFEGREVAFTSPREALDAGIATVYQDLALAPLMSITRNYFLGREPTIGRGPLRRFDVAGAAEAARAGLARIGIDVRDPNQAVGTLSGGERQCVAIARALHFGAKVLILDEPTSALGVHQAGVVIESIRRARANGVGVVFITHNVQHALGVADHFTVLNRGKSLGTFAKGAVERDELMDMMSGLRGAASGQIADE